MAHWSFNPNISFSKIMYNTLVAVFKYVEIRTTQKGDINFYASDRPLDVPAIEGDEKNEEVVRQILGNERQDINTIEEPLLEKYFNTNRVFVLPDDYKEQYLSTGKFIKDEKNI